MSAETIFTELVEQFKIDVENATKEALDKIHDDMVPYLNDDTENNARYRAVDIVRSIMRGDFDMEGDHITVDILSAKAGDVAKDKKIERLERQLKEAIEFKYS